MRDTILALLSLVAATAGLTLFAASLDVGSSSLAGSPLSLFAWRPRDPNARPIQDAPSPRTDRVQR